jgi:hypothetical protein
MQLLDITIDDVTAAYNDLKSVKVWEFSVHSSQISTYYPK